MAAPLSYNATHTWADISDGDIQTPSDHTWVLARSIGIMGMQGGFALLEAGCVRALNRANIMMKNIADMSFCMAMYMAFGYSWSFAVEGSFAGFVGGSKYFFLNGAPNYTMFFYHFSFAATTGTIVSGAVAGRIRFKPYILLSVFVTNVIYPFCVHWAWTEEGWLKQMDFVDFAGAGVVHLVGGTAALVAALMLGPRTGRFPRQPNWQLVLEQRMSRIDDFFAMPFAGGAGAIAAAAASKSNMKVHPEEPSSGNGSDAGAASTANAPMPSPAGQRSCSISEQGTPNGSFLRRKSSISGEARMERRQSRTDMSLFKVSDPVNIVYGTFVLMIGWLSFNMSGAQGLTPTADSPYRFEIAGRIAVVTMAGASFGAIAGMLYSNVAFAGIIRIEQASLGCLAGLVSVTAACASIEIWQGALAAFIGGLLACAASSWLAHHCIDDPVSAVPVHLVGGLWGLIVVGIFGRGEDFGKFPKVDGRGEWPESRLAGFIHGGSFQLLGVQCIGALALLGWAAMGTALIMRLLACTVGVRVSLAAEMEGLDVSEHGVGESDKVLRERLYRRRMRWRKRLGMKVPEKEAEDKYGASPGNSTHSGESFGAGSTPASIRPAPAGKGTPGMGLIRCGG